MFNGISARKLSIIAVLLATTSLATGCSQLGSGDPSSAQLEAPTSVGSFSGPWAAEFQDFHENATSEFERGALADGVISDQEFSEMTERFRSCLSSAEISFSGFDRDGAYSLTPPAKMDADTVHAKQNSCSEEAGEKSIGALHAWVARNPDNQNEASIMVECMIRKGLVDASYTAEDWTRDNEQSPVPAFIPANQTSAYEECANDPLGLFVE